MSNIPRNIFVIASTGKEFQSYFDFTKTDEGFVITLRNPVATEGMCATTARYVLDRSDAMALAQSLVNDLMSHHD